MGIDLKAGGRRVGHNKRTAPVSEDVYKRLLVKLFKFLGRRADSKFSSAVADRLCMSRINNPPLSLSKLARLMKDKESKVGVIVGTVTNDNRLLEVPQLKICAMKFTEGARARIVKAGGARLRPVLLTAITTIFGLIPLAIGLNINFYTLFSEFDADIYFGGDNVIFWGPLAWTVIYGLVIATFLTLVVVPILFYLTTQFKMWLRNYRSSNIISS